MNLEKTNTLPVVAYSLRIPTRLWLRGRCDDRDKLVIMRLLSRVPAKYIVKRAEPIFLPRLDGQSMVRII